MKNKTTNLFLMRNNTVSKNLVLLLLVLFITSCGVYTLNDVSIDYTKIKTIKLFTIENKASYVNPQLSPKLYDKLLQKITNSTKLTRTNKDDADYQVTA